MPIRTLSIRFLYWSCSEVKSCFFFFFSHHWWRGKYQCKSENCSQFKSSHVSVIWTNNKNMWSSCMYWIDREKAESLLVVDGVVTFELSISKQPSTYANGSHPQREKEREREKRTRYHQNRKWNLFGNKCFYCQKLLKSNLKYELWGVSIQTEACNTSTASNRNDQVDIVHRASNILFV